MKKLVLVLLFMFSTLFANEETHYEYAKVVRSKAVYEEIEVVRPHVHSHDCYETYRVHKPQRRKVSENNLGIDTLIGVASGVVIGNQIGKGNGRVAAKVIGGILGGTVANKIRNVSYHGDDEYEYETRQRRVCHDRYDTYETKRVLKGYKNYFYYNGKKYHKFTKRAKKRIRVTTTMHY
jgi:uncharacterized protein YcfJ